MIKILTDAECQMRIDRLAERLKHPGLKGEQWQGVAKELLSLLDRDPQMANAHVIAWREQIAQLVELMLADRVPMGPFTELPVLLSDPPVFEARKVPNPNLEEELAAAGDDAAARARVPRVVGAVTNRTTQIGGLARVRGRTKAQCEAAEHYRLLWERSLIGGAKAIDYAEPRVQTSIGSSTAVTDMGEDARLAYERARARVGDAARLIELIVCNACSLREVAALWGFGQSTEKREGLRGQLLEALNVLVAHFRIGGAGGRLRVVGDRPMDTSTQVVIERKACAA